MSLKTSINIEHTLIKGLQKILKAYCLDQEKELLDFSTLPNYLFEEDFYLPQKYNNIVKNSIIYKERKVFNHTIQTPYLNRDFAEKLPPSFFFHIKQNKFFHSDNLNLLSKYIFTLFTSAYFSSLSVEKKEKHIHPMIFQELKQEFNSNKYTQNPINIGNYYYLGKFYSINKDYMSEISDAIKTILYSPSAPHLSSLISLHTLYHFNIPFLNNEYFTEDDKKQLIKNTVLNSETDNVNSCQFPVLNTLCSLCNNLGNTIYLEQHGSKDIFNLFSEIITQPELRNLFNVEIKLLQKKLLVSDELYLKILSSKYKSDMTLSLFNRYIDNSLTNLFNHKLSDKEISEIVFSYNSSFNNLPAFNIFEYPQTFQRLGTNTSILKSYLLNNVQISSSLSQLEEKQLKLKVKQQFSKSLNISLNQLTEASEKVATLLARTFVKDLKDISTNIRAHKLHQSLNANKQAVHKPLKKI